MEKEEAAKEALRLFEESLKEVEVLGEQVLMEKQEVSATACPCEAF